MRTTVLLTCVVACIASVGCSPKWEMKWPSRNAAKDDGDTKAKASPTSRPAERGPTLAQENEQLRRQIATLRERLEVIENENARLSKTNESVEELKEALKKQTFTARMQAEDLKILKTAAVERDLYKTRSERLQRDIAKLKARIEAPQKPPAARGAETRPAKAPATRPAGT